MVINRVCTIVDTEVGVGGAIAEEVYPYGGVFVEIKVVYKKKCVPIRCFA